MKDRRYKACQHCLRKVRLLPNQNLPSGPDQAYDSKGDPQCVPGLLHKIMPVVGGEGEGVG